MKKMIIAISIGLMFIVNCTGVKTMSAGLENESYLVFEGNPGNYSGGVDVLIDDNLSFKAEVNKEHSNSPKGTLYKISTGNHLVTVSYNNDVVFRKTIFVSSQETKIIVLP